MASSAPAWWCFWAPCPFEGSGCCIPGEKCKKGMLTWADGPHPNPVQVESLKQIVRNHVAGYHHDDIDGEEDLVERCLNKAMALSTCELWQVAVAPTEENTRASRSRTPVRPSRRSRRSRRSRMEGLPPASWSRLSESSASTPTDAPDILLPDMRIYSADDLCEIARRAKKELRRRAGS